MRNRFGRVLCAVILLAATGCVVAPRPVAAPPTPPPYPAEVVPPQPGPGYVWVAGHWGWRPRERRYVWLPGRWVVPQGPGYAWTPGHWEPRPGGYVWIEGHWRR